MTAPRYQVGEAIGRGGMGVVHRGHDRLLGHDVALKFLRTDDPGATARLFREARAQARVRHDGLCRVHDVGQLDGHAFIAMQLVPGPSLRELGPSLAVRERARVVRDVAVAVHAAHRVGLIHRDLKPSNVLCVTGDGGRVRPVVIDFGLARALDDSTITRAGQVMGTPAYMAPEQALGRTGEIDRRTDVYALGATLYELCAGAPPFTGADHHRVLDDVIGRPPAPLRPRHRDVPADLEAIALRCLRKDPAERYDSARAVAEDLDRFLAGEPIAARQGTIGWRLRQATRRGRGWIALVGLIAIAAVVAAVVVRRSGGWQRRERIAALVRDGEGALTRARAARAELARDTAAALAAFDGGDRVAGEARWTSARARLPAIDDAYERAGRAFEAALDAGRGGARVRAALAATLVERVTWAEERGRPTEREILRRRLEIHDPGGAVAGQLDEPATVTLTTRPAAAEVAVAPYLADSQGKLVEGPAEPRGGARVLRVPPGSWLLVLTAPGAATVRYPIRVERGEQRTIVVELPAATAVPAGFVPVPAGRFLVGSDDEDRRRVFEAAPLHAIETGGYLIARDETTVGDWLGFLDAAPADERARRTPGADRPDGDAVALTRLGPGRWRYTFRPSAGRSYQAVTGEPLRYPRRRLRIEQDWTRFPVTGVSGDDARAYLAWLDATGRVPGARLCTAREWERAARGADEREYPAGHRLDPDDANIDSTYDRDDWGPDQVGSHPGSRSPFGVDDLAGNAMELVAPADPRDPGAATRGGGYNFNAGMSDVLNPNAFGAGARDTSVGLRVCAPWP